MTNRPPRNDKPGFGHRPTRPAGDRPAYGKPEFRSDRPARPAGDRPAYGKPEFRGDRPARPAGDRPAYGKPEFRGDRPARPAGDRPAYGKPEFRSDRPARPAGDRPAYGKPGFRGDRPARPMGDRPARPAGDRPARPMGNRPMRPGFARPVPQPSMPAESAHVTASRRIAYEILHDVTTEGAFAALALNTRLSASQMNQQDRRLCANIVYTTLENRLAIDYILDQFLTQSTTDPLIRDVLRMSVCQILYFDKVPDSAAVNEAVKLIRDLKMDPLSGMVNGVLRNIVREKENLPWPDAAEDPVKALSVKASMPEWIVRKLTEEYGAEIAEQIVSYRPEDYPTVIRPNLTKLTDAQFEKLLSDKVWDVRPGLVPHTWLVKGASEIAMDRDYRAGNFTIQGESSVLCALAMDVKLGQQILDACAAPGGKACLMAEMMQGTGRVYAWDLHSHRVELIRAYQQRMGMENLRPAVKDATELKEDLVEMLDGVLLDAPCMGLGVMTSKPDVKYAKKEEDVADLVETQRKLLDTVCQYVKKGGTLVYSTCSILKEENENQIASFLSRHTEFEKVPLPLSIPEAFREKDDANGLQLLPSRDGVEGFFIAKLRKKRG